MRNLIKIVCGICTLLSFTAFALVLFGCKTIPDNITVIENTEYKAPNFFGISVFKSEIISSSKAGAVLGTAQAPQNQAQIKLLNIIPVKNAEITSIKRKYVIPGGEIFGIKLYTDGVMIVDSDTVDTERGKVNPGEDAGLKVGDIIKSVNGQKVSSSKELVKLIEKSKGKSVRFAVLRNHKKITVDFKCEKEKTSGKYKAGLWVRDSTAGIGTVTFHNNLNNSFAGLGHAICDSDTDDIMPLGKGEMAEAYISGFYKSSKGNVGELCGVLTGKTLGKLCVNCDTGIYGYMNEKVDSKSLIPVAVSREVHKGKVKILCTIDENGPQYYDAEIVKLYSNPSSVNKDMVIEITDERFLRRTGGILQGMSGTPIIQDGMLVGAITHVLVNNPKQGYAIFAEKMVETSECREMEKFNFENKQAS